MTAVDIVDALSDTEHWLNWSRFFGPISGHDAKLENPSERYLITTFCYGCNLGPTQTARSIKGLDRRQVSFVALRCFLWVTESVRFGHLIALRYACSRSNPA